MNYNQGRDHPRFIDLTGRQFGQLKILEYIKVQEKAQFVWKWKCLCSCGSYTMTRTKDFQKQKPVQSCRSCGRKRMGKTNILPDNLSLKNRVYRNYRRNAVNRGYLFNLDLDEFLQIISQNCHYCNAAPKEYKGEKDYSYNNSSFKRNGIDRKDNTKGYSGENILPCCSTCNNAKMEMTYSDFLGFIEQVYKNLLNK